MEEVVKKLPMIDFKLLSALETMPEEQKKEWDDYVLQQEKKLQNIACDKNYKSCGIGEEYFTWNMNKLPEDDIKKTARHYFSVVTGGGKANLLCYGDTGTGKTTLIAALLNQFAHTVKKEVYGLKVFYSIRYMTSKDICTRLRQAEAFNPIETRAEVLRDILSCDVIAIDEIGRHSDQAEKEYLFSIIDLCNQNHKSIMLATNLSEQTLKEHLGVAILSRLNSACGLHVANFTGKKDFRINK